MSFWESLLLSAGTQAVTLAIVAFVVKTIISHALSKDVERFRAELKERGERELEQFRASLQLAATEHRVRFSALHERTAETLAGAYERLHKLHASSAEVLTGAGNVSTLTERQKKFDETLAEMVNYFFPREIFIPAALAERTRVLVLTLRGMVIEAAMVPHAGFGSNTGGVWDRLLVTVNQEVPKLLNSIGTQYRAYLGMKE